jgi:hypothetical protein
MPVLGAHEATESPDAYACAEACDREAIHLALVPYFLGLEALCGVQVARTAPISWHTASFVTRCPVCRAAMSRVSGAESVPTRNV